MPELPHIAILTDDEALANSLEKLLLEHALMTRFPALKAFQEYATPCHFDAVFCDWSIGTDRWLEALKAVRGQCPDLPLIVLSKHGGEEEWVAVIEAGAFDLLAPPYGRGSVLPVVEQALASHEGRHRHAMHLQRHEEAR